MPYRVAERKGQHCVVKVQNGVVMGCHATRRDALRQIAAIEASEAERKPTRAIRSPKPADE